VDHAECVDVVVEVTGTVPAIGVEPRVVLDALVEVLPAG
jgi:hypothetical protein